jgi:hypothetical protein
MVAQRVVSSKYLGIGLAIATGVAFNLGSSLHAQAQDLNLQTQLIILSPLPLQVTPPATDVSIPSTKLGLAEALKSPNCPITPEQRASIDEYLKKNSRATVFDYNNDLANKRKNKKILGGPNPPPDLSCSTGQPTKIKVSVPINPTYETNVLKTGNNSSHGESFGIGGNVLVTTAGLQGRPFDQVVMYAAEASSRYTPSAFSSQNVDSINSYMAYQVFLHANGYYRDGSSIKNIDPSTPPAKLPDPNMTTVDTVAFAIQNQTAFMPTFHKEKADFFTPQFTLSSQNINLDDPKHTAECGMRLQAFCQYANLALTVGQSFSDVTTQQNFNVAGSATLGWRIDGNWSLLLQTMATGKEYENFVGGRRDLLLQAGPALTYANGNVSFQLPVTYFKNYSTVSTAAWSGLVIQPTLTISFTYNASLAMLPN